MIEAIEAGSTSTVRGVRRGRDGGATMGGLGASPAPLCDRTPSTLLQ